MSKWRNSLALLLVFALFAAACGGGSDGGESATDDDVAEVDTDAGDDGGDDEEAMEDEEEAMEDDEDAESAVEAGTEAEGDVDSEVVESDEVGLFGGTVTIGIEAEATGLRPWEDACSSPCINMTTSIFDKLVELRADGTYGPWLASEFSSNADFTQWSFTLREGVTFHNGVEFNANTIAEIWPLWVAGAQSSGLLSAAGVAVSYTHLTLPTTPYV